MCNHWVRRRISLNRLGAAALGNRDGGIRGLAFVAVVLHHVDRWTVFSVGRDAGALDIRDP